MSKMVVPSPSNADSRPHILIADDEATITLLLQHSLEPHYQVTTVANGFEALKRLEATNFDLVISDIQMPIVDGFQLLKTLRENPAYVDLPIVLMSGMNDDEDIVRGLELGANDYLTKPLEQGVVLARVRTQIELKRLMDMHKQTNNDLRQMQAMRDRFFTMASHDLKNPMNQIRMAQFLLRGTLAEDPDTDTLLDNIEIALDTMGDIVREYLEMAALKSQPLELALEKVAVEPVLWDVVNQYTINAEKKAVLLKITTDEGTVRADAQRLAQAVSNLVSNAIKYSPANSCITLFTSEHDRCVRLNVQDEGPGIPEDERDQLFTEFGQLSTQPTGGESRSGLGLWIVKQLVELQQGTVGVECPASGGSIFWLELPTWSVENNDDTRPDRNQVMVAPRT